LLCRLAFSVFNGERGAGERKPTSNERRSARLFESRSVDFAEVFEKTVERFGFSANVSSAFCRAKRREP
jgi:hypothetical protein